MRMTTAAPSSSVERGSCGEIVGFTDQNQTQNAHVCVWRKHAFCPTSKRGRNGQCRGGWSVPSRPRPFGLGRKATSEGEIRAGWKCIGSLAINWWTWFECQEESLGDVGHSVRVRIKSGMNFNGIFYVPSKLDRLISCLRQTVCWITHSKIIFTFSALRQKDFGGRSE